MMKYRKVFFKKSYLAAAAAILSNATTPQWSCPTRMGYVSCSLENDNDCTTKVIAGVNAAGVVSRMNGANCPKSKTIVQRIPVILCICWILGSFNDIAIECDMCGCPGVALEGKVEGGREVCKKHKKLHNWGCGGAYHLDTALIAWKPASTICQTPRLAPSSVHSTDTWNIASAIDGIFETKWRSTSLTSFRKKSKKCSPLNRGWIEKRN
jgi:hypothetical protein